MPYIRKVTTVTEFFCSTSSKIYPMNLRWQNFQMLMKKHGTFCLQMTFSNMYRKTAILSVISDRTMTILNTGRILDQKASVLWDAKFKSKRKVWYGAKSDFLLFVQLTFMQLSKKALYHFHERFLVYSSAHYKNDFLQL